MTNDFEAKILYAIVLLSTATAAIATPIAAQDTASAALRASVAELRHVAGTWNTTTDFLKPDGGSQGAFEGTYQFEWVVPDRVLKGHSENPALEQASAILFYIRESDQQIEMVSVGADGKLWVMTGPLGGNARTVGFTTADGNERTLRFTRYNVTPDAFESKMDYSDDGGATWVPGNHQRFIRVPG